MRSAKISGSMAKSGKLDDENPVVTPKQIALALQSYDAAYGALPPAYIADEQGRPMHSWRVLILPFLEQQSLYDQYDFQRTVGRPQQHQAPGQDAFHVRCPSNHAPGPAVSTFTSYVVISGPGTMFPGAESIRLDQVTDGPAETLMVVEVANLQIPWTKPEDLDVTTMGSRVNDREISEHLEQSLRRSQCRTRRRVLVVSCLNRSLRSG